MQAKDVPLFNHRHEPIGCGSILYTALYQQDEIIGVISTDNALTGKPFTDQQCELLRLFANTLSHLCILKRTEGQLRATTSTLETLIHTAPSAIITADQNLTVTMWNATAERIFGWTEADIIGQSLPTSADGELDPVHRWMRQSMTGEIAAPTELLWRRQDDTTVEINLAAAPLRNAAGAIHGSIAVITDITERKRIQRQREAVAEIALRLRTAQTADEIIRLILTELMGLFQADAAALCLKDAVSGETVTKLGLGQMAVTTGLRTPAKQGIVGQVIDTGKLYITENIYSEPNFLRLPFAHVPPIQLHLPLILEGASNGAVIIGRHKHPFRSEEVELMTAVADLAATAIHRSLLHEQIQQNLHKTNALYTYAQRLINTTALPELMHAIVDGTAAALPADRVSLVLFDLETRQIREFVVGGNRSYPQVIGTFDDLWEGLAGWVIRNRQATISPDTEPDARESEKIRQIRQTLEIGSTMLAPVQVHNQILGTLTANNTRKGPAFSQEDLALLEAIANQAAIAIENAHLLQQIQIQAEQMQRLMDAVPDGLVLLDWEGKIQFTNPAARLHLQVLGKTDQDERLSHLNGLPLADFLTRDGEAPMYELSVGHPPSVYEIQIHPMETGRQPEGWVLVSHDATQEKERQQRALQQGQLAAVGQLAAGVAHDFNNIVGAIMIYTQLLQNTTSLSGKDRERTQMIHQQAHHAAELVRQLLDFSRNAVIERTSINFVPFCKEMIKLLDRTLPGSIQMEFSHTRNEFMVNADATRLQQVMINLILNARDAMPKGGRILIALDAVEVRADQPGPLAEMNAGPWLQLQLSDTGTGIDEQTLTRIFEPFFTTKEQGKGTGLGLAQVYGIIKQHDGHIGVESTLGLGTTFTLYLPLDVAAIESLQTEAAPTAKTISTSVLVVEDNAPIRNALEDFLELNGYEVFTAGTGTEALALLAGRTEPIGLVISDISMPGMSGTDLFRHLIRSYPGLKMMIMTGYPLENQGRGLLEEGIVDWIQKPFGMDDLLHKIERAVEEG